MKLWAPRKFSGFRKLGLEVRFELDADGVLAVSCRETVRDCAVTVVASDRGDASLPAAVHALPPRPDAARCARALLLGAEGARNPASALAALGGQPPLLARIWSFARPHPVRAASDVQLFDA